MKSTGIVRCLRVTDTIQICPESVFWIEVLYTINTIRVKKTFGIN